MDWKGIYVMKGKCKREKKEENTSFKDMLAIV
jgi:hypothetical protein